MLLQIISIVFLLYHFVLKLLQKFQSLQELHKNEDVFYFLSQGHYCSFTSLTMAQSKELYLSAF